MVAGRANGFTTFPIFKIRLNNAELYECNVCAFALCTSVASSVVMFLFGSPASSQYNNRSGIVVTPSSTIKPGKVCVLLDGETNALAFKLKNVRTEVDGSEGGIEIEQSMLHPATDKGGKTGPAVNLLTKQLRAVQ